MKDKKLTIDQKRRIKKLRERKDALVWQFIGAMNEINAQIDEIRTENTMSNVSHRVLNEISYDEEGEDE